MSDKKTITTIVRNGNKCVVYEDDGWYCTWKNGVQDFNFELVSNVKAGATGLVLLVSEQEARANGGDASFDDFGKWCIPRYRIWQIYGELEVEPEEEKLVNFMRGLMI